MNSSSEKQQKKTIFTVTAILTVSFVISTVVSILQLNYIHQHGGYIGGFHRAGFNVSMTIVTCILVGFFMVMVCVKPEEKGNCSPYRIYSGKESLTNFMMTILLSIQVYLIHLGLSVVSGIEEIEVIILIPLVPFLCFIIGRMLKDSFSCSFHGEILSHRFNICYLLFDIILNFIAETFVIVCLQKFAVTGTTSYLTVVLMPSIYLTINFLFSIWSFIVSKDINEVEKKLFRKMYTLGPPTFIDGKLMDSDALFEQRNNLLLHKFQVFLKIDALFLSMLSIIQLSLYIAFTEL